MNAYQELEKLNERASALGNAMGILGWDEATTMREGSAAGRAQMMGHLSVLAHEFATDPRRGDLIEEAEGMNELGDWERANVREMKHHYLHATAVPADLIEKMVHARSDAGMTWRSARGANDFAALAPKLEKLFDLTREYAAAKASALGKQPYDALLDTYDPGRTTQQVDAIFGDLEEFLPPLIDEVIAHQAAGPEIIEPTGPFPAENQKALGEAIMKLIGFPFERGFLDVSHHPFSGGADRDVRITTRYEENDFTASLMAVVHETGHALYQDGLPLKWRQQPVGDHRGMTLHESQSLLLEMQAARTDEFIRHISPLVKETLKGEGPAWNADNLIRLYRRVKRGLIRVYADEVTYPLHVILRYRLEKAILNKDIPVKDLPGEWNKMMVNLVGIEPPDDKDGVMQDVHWPEGIFGYFPTYSLGAVTAAQLFKAATDKDPSVVPSLGEGNFKPLFAWLDENVRGRACLLTPDELIEQATGKPLGTDDFKAHLKRRYLGT
ncbi:MAG: carboxypeptidase M32 [Alphaproteobacteria bacterium]|nr:MAG: carboxypeptidase M32 [Alphaproteobacteria bacterium]